jgi:aryl-alcohol dehydrogenase-like predicted oxidoreductase
MANHVFFSGQGGSPALPPGMSHHEYLMRFISTRFGDGTILVGTRNPSHLHESARWADSPLPPDKCRALEKAFSQKKVSE